MTYHNACLVRRGYLELHQQQEVHGAGAQRQRSLTETSATRAHQLATPMLLCPHPAGLDQLTTPSHARATLDFPGTGSPRARPVLKHISARAPGHITMIILRLKYNQARPFCHRVKNNILNGVYIKGQNI